MSAHGSSAQQSRLADGRWHLQHGPIDLIISCDGVGSACADAIAECWESFVEVLPRLVEELVELRHPVDNRLQMRGAVARRMHDACKPFGRTRFVTSMAAVAGAVADHLIVHFQRPGIARASINNGGDIAYHLAPDQSYTVGVLANTDSCYRERMAPIALDGTLDLRASLPVRGLATSGWRGRSFSLGIADSVTVMAETAARADVAATLIANAVNVNAQGIVRHPARALKDDSDLGSRLVTTFVPVLPDWLVAQALDRGRVEAEHWRDMHLIHSAVLFLQGQVIVVDPLDRLGGDISHLLSSPRHVSCSTHLHSY